MILIQPEGMQSFLKHRVEGIMTPFIRWVITIRDVDPDLLRSSSLEKGTLVAQLSQPRC